MVAAETEHYLTSRSEQSPDDATVSDDGTPDDGTPGYPYEPSAQPSLGNVVRLERRSTPTWLKALLLLVHLVPLVLIAASSGVLPQPGLASVKHAASALYVLIVLVAVAELVNYAIQP
mgnify:FL=1|tara:strand:- start:258 stop:611 length:354 start_codon:yes stop_codon:yes gene_type:complete